jgi:UDP-N-acetylenolpyruvoylglucosamine reductase
MSENTQWEYRIETLGSAFRSPKPDQTEVFINELGLEGWEVVSLHQPHSSNMVWVTAKRALSSTTRRQRNRPDDQW